MCRWRWLVLHVHLGRPPFLESQDIRRWSGPRSLLLWLPLPDYAGFATRDTSPARDSGLTVRTLSETARDTLSWARTAGELVTGLTADEESAALKAWHASDVRATLVSS